MHQNQDAEGEVLDEIAHCLVEHVVIIIYSIPTIFLQIITFQRMYVLQYFKFLNFMITTF